MQEVLLVAPRGFCAGVSRAIDTVKLALLRYRAPVYVRRSIVHNAEVVAELAALGAIFVKELAEVPDGACVVFSAHGVSQAVRHEASRRGLRVVDATCPLVEKVHMEALRYLAQGLAVVLLGHPDHDETIGTLGEAPGRIHLVSTLSDVSALPMPDGATVAYLTQTTLSDEQVAPLVAALRRRYPRLRAPRTADVCYATQNRQAAVRWLAQYADRVLVLGDPTSSNSQRLVEVAMAEGVVAMLASSIDTVPESWLTAATVLGLTAGASTPDHLVQAAVARFVGAGVPVREKRLGAETTHFSLPKELDIPAVVLAGAAVAVVA